ncbi:RB1-inducible coiled-coil protein 1 isoform X2 [Ischnura elegans]|uniref:RB1-inducible coiled-coil protein 1 isoform X2 n=1 Tax=Ischnura elegans TaxID=197161 RepID=UPI001ED8875C|nr:RB1-inducible coiled-coil protein 1 isoform X2 [Ischnura elegans]
MLYIFHVDTGTMMTFDMNLALESVSHLKEVVAREIHIAVEKQVLLVSGGESLDPNARVCSYSAGTDTNPIYLFSLASIESSTPPSPSTHSLSGDISDFDPKERVEATRNSPSTLETVTNRSRLAQELCELARLETRACECLVHDQHLQQQGWAAVVANLEDITAAFRSRAEVFRQSFRHHLDTREESAILLQNFSSDLAVLGKITLPSALLQKSLLLDEASNQREDATGEEEKVEEKEACQETLLGWISAKDNSCSLEQVASRCAKGLEQFDSTVLESLISNVEQALDATNVPDMKEIKGLEERLFGLEQLMFEAKKIVQDQSDLAQAFIQNQNRAGNLRDPSILPDLCASHMKQLLVMLRNQQQLRDIRRRCTKAKEELSMNLYYRLRWIMYVENGICEVDSKLGIYHEGLKRLQRNLEVVRQVHRAPALYAMAVSEVVRRRTFSEAFLNWARELSSRLSCVLGEEEDKRRNFEQATQGHFLTSLFPNMGEKPPPYATRPPPPFDRDLPKLTSTDVENLRAALPELADSIFKADPTPIHRLFNLGPAFPPHIEQGENVQQEVANAAGEVAICDGAQPSEEEQHEQQSKVDDDSSNTLPVEQTVQAQSPSKSVVEQGTVAQTRTVSGDQDGGFESETDTEEFEKVGRSPSAEGESEGQGIGTGTVLREGECPGAELDAAEENLGSLRAELERLQRERQRWRTEVSGALTDLRRELMVLRAQVDPSRGMAPEEDDGAGEAVSWRSLKEAMVELGKGLSTVQQRAAEESLRREEDVKRLEEALSVKEKRLATAESDMRRAVKEAEERMRVRFRLVASCTSMERSPSDGSLERGERGEHHSGEAYSSSSPPLPGQLHHVPYVAAAIATAVSEERVRWEASYQVVFNEALRRVLAEKEKEKEVLRRDGESYRQECSRLREIVANLSGDAPSPLPCSSPSSSPLSSPLPPLPPPGSPPSSLGEPVVGETGSRLAPPRRSLSNPVGVEPRMTETMSSSVAVMKESTAPHELAHAQKSAKKLAVDGLLSRK